MNTTDFHPMIVHFPIALLLTGLLFAAISMFCNKCCCKKSAESCTSATERASCIEKMSFWLLALGTLGAAGAVASGFFFTPAMDSVFYASHQSFAISTVAVAVVATAISAYSTFRARSNGAVKWIAFLLYVAIGVMVAMTAHYGGFLR